ncbi:MAG: radical SAM family heme chaperone HemW [Oscillospiraceae bacterium]|nr:radical SAM family heme chaperone HemW [Oscillospiraceae bacterium]
MMTNEMNPAGISRGDPEGVSVYYHFPFCVRKCNYCAFYSVAKTEDALLDAYLQALCLQTRAADEHREVVSVYFGGGTPSVFGAERLCRLLAVIREKFSLSPDAEVTVEVNPATADEAFFRALHDAGCNRLSVGMQSSDDEELRRLGRIHTFRDVQTCLADARKAGFDDISLDLLFALPGQTAETFRRSLLDAFALAPTHLSVYSLQLEEGTAFYRHRQTLSFPSEDEEEAQYDLLCGLAAEHGYEHYEISSFAREGHYARHNLRYWQRGEYLGFGPAAHSHWNGRRFSNTADLKAYLANPLGANDYAAAERISEAEALEEEILLGLRTSFGIPAYLAPRERVERLCGLGLLVQNGDRISLTERGWRVSNAVIGQLLP